MTVRRLRPEDRPAWDVLWDGYLTFYETVLEAGVTDATFARLCEGRDGMLGLVAEDDDGALAGFAHVLVHPSTWTTDTYLYLEDLFVGAAARGRGIARQLIAAVYDFAGPRKVYWHTREDNPARALYDRVARYSGFVVYERC